MILTTFIRDKKGHPKGVLIATNYNEVGYSLCSKKDNWDKELGLRIAFDRAVKGFHTEVPYSIKYDFALMEDRANRYFRKNR